MQYFYYDIATSYFQQIRIHHKIGSKGIKRFDIPI